MKPNQKLSISFIATALNEEENVISAINRSLSALDDYGINGEVIVINDGSTDRTRSLVEGVMENDTRIKLINHDTPHGLGASFWDGVDLSSCDVICWMPGDDEGNPLEILRYFKLLEDVDIVVPFQFNKEDRSLFRKLLSKCFNIIFNTTFFVSLNYTNGTILYKRLLLKEINHKCSSFFFQADILVRLLKKGYFFSEVPYLFTDRKAGESKAIKLSTLINVMKDYLNLFKDVYIRRKIKKEKHFLKGTSTYKRYKALSLDAE